MLAVVEDDLLVQLGEIVGHHCRCSILSGDLRMGLETIPDDAIQLLANGCATDAFNNLTSESVNQHASRSLGADPASPQVKHRFLIQLANGRAMRALDVISVNLQLGLGIRR